MPTTTILFGALAAGGVMIVLLAIFGGGNSRVEGRVREIKDGTAGRTHTASDRAKEPGNLARTALPKMGRRLIPADEAERTRLLTRLVNAGYYSRQAMPAYLAAKVLLMAGPPAICFALFASRVFNFNQAMMFGSAFGMLGIIGPRTWLDRAKSARQIRMRRALPDALDVLVICVEGGLSLAAALQRVEQELEVVHPELAGELGIVRQEVHLGRTVGEALRHFGQRADLEEVRNLATVVLQADRFGAGLTKSLRVHAETLRLRRRQHAEELAQKAGTKILFPTLLFIFPVIFVVVLGPAVVQITETVLNK